MDTRLFVEQRPGSIEFFFDPQCPFAYQTSRWIREVASYTGLRIGWRFFSLELANHEENDPLPWEKGWSRGWSLMRIGARLRAQDPGLLDRWYAAVGQAIHEDGRPAYRRDVAEQLVEELGLPGTTIELALADDSTSDAVLEDHEWLVSTHGGFGVPTLVFPWGKALYGPVVAPAPAGEEALRLWNIVLQSLSVSNLYELKMPKSEADMEHIGRTFAPTSRAREAAAGR